MKIQTIKFPQTIEETENKINEVRPLLDKYFQEVYQMDSSHLDTGVFVMLWHEYKVDFIELMENGERVGLCVLSIIPSDPSTNRGAILMAGYIEPEYRGKGYFKAAMNYISTVLQARSFDYFDIPVSPKVNLSWFSNPNLVTYRKEL